jgi:hypothetical protein
MSKVICCNLECKNYNDGQCTKETIEMSSRYMEDSDGKSYYIHYCTDEE